MAKKDFMAAFLKEREKPVSNLDTIKVTPLATNMIGENSDNFYDVDDIDDLVESIREHGLLHPIVTNNGTTVISGHRRLAAYRRLLEETGDEKYKMIPCIVLHPSDPIESEMMMIEANSTARILTPYELMEQAKRYDVLLVKAKDHGYEYEGRRRDIVAKMMKVSPAKVGRYAAIDKNLDKSWKFLFEKNEISESVAYEISKMESLAQDALLDESLNAEGHVEGITLADVQEFAVAWDKPNAVHAGDEPEAAPESEPASDQQTKHEAVLDEWRNMVEDEDERDEDFEHFWDSLEDEEDSEAESNEKISPYICLGRRFKQLREDRSFTRKQMADFLGWYSGTYSAIENGNGCSIDRLCDAAKTLDVSLDWLVGFSDTKKPTINISKGRARLTSERCSGIKSGYWSPAKKEELIQRLGEYEDAEFGRWRH